METLPTKDQVNALTDVSSLSFLMDDIEKAILHIETQLEFSGNDGPWARSAQNALALHRFTERQIHRRIESLKISAPKGKGVAVRPDNLCDPLTLEVLQSLPAINVSDFRTVEQVDERQAWIVERLNALEADRADEIGLAPLERDERFMAATGAALRNLKAQRSSLQIERGRITRSLKSAAHKAQDAQRQQAFIEAAKTVLDKETYLRIWSVAEAMNPFAKLMAASHPSLSDHQPDRGGTQNSGGGDG